MHVRRFLSSLALCTYLTCAPLAAHATHETQNEVLSSLITYALTQEQLPYEEDGVEKIAYIVQDDEFAREHTDYDHFGFVYTRSPNGESPDEFALLLLTSRRILGQPVPQSAHILVDGGLPDTTLDGIVDGEFYRERLSLWEKGELIIAVIGEKLFQYKDRAEAIQNNSQELYDSLLAEYAAYLGIQQ